MKYRYIMLCLMVFFLFFQSINLTIPTQAADFNLIRLYDTQLETLEQCSKQGIRLIEAYPSYILLETQAPQLDWIKNQNWYYLEEKDYQLLRYNGHIFYSQENKSIQIPSSLKNDALLGKLSDLFLIQWIGPEKTEWLKILKAYDVTMLFPIHQYGWVCHLSSDSYAKILDLPFIRSCAAIPFSAKIHYMLFSLLNRNSDQSFGIEVLAHSLFDLNSFLSRSGLDHEDIVFKLSNPFNSLIIEDYPMNNLSILALDKNVFRIEPYLPYEPFNSRAARVVGTQYRSGGINTTIIPGLDGSGEIAGVADTGIRSTHPDFWDPTFSDKVIATFPSNWDDYHSHGTHVAGTVCGTGSSSPNQQLKGIAYNARLVSQNFLGNQSYYNTVGGLYALLQEAYNAGARTHNNSWGYSWNALYHMNGAGEYTAGARDLDRFLWDNMDFTMVKSAGNNRDYTYSIFYNNYFGPYPFPLGTRTITADSNAKNIICVGALENENGTSGGAYSWRSPQLSIQRYIAYFSSTGPTHDNRIKPDVVAPGDPLESCNRNHLSSPFTPYRLMSGTSMSGPVVTGSAVLVRQYYREYHQLASNAISSALVKATLINGSTQSLQDNDFPASANYYGYSNEPFPLNPNPWTGFGKIHVKNSLLPEDKKVLFVNAYDPNDHQLGISNQEPFNVYYFRSKNTSLPIKATLAWTDYADAMVPPNATSFDFHQKDLINDIHLELTDLTSMDSFRGNQMNQGFSSPNPNDFDHVNNVEQIVLPSGNEGIYRIIVFTLDTITSDQAHAYRQPYALVLSGEDIEWIDPSEVPDQHKPVQPMNFTSVQHCQGIQLSWTAPRFMPLPNYFLLTRRTWSGAFAGQQTTQRLEGDVASWLDTAIQWGTHYYYMLSAYDENDEVLAHAPGVMVGNIIPPSRPQLNAAYVEDMVQLYWSRPAEGTCPINRYRLYRSFDPHALGTLVAELSVTENNFVDHSLQSGDVAYYTLQAIDSRDVISLKSFPVRISVPVIETMLKLWIEAGKTELCPNEWLTVRVMVHNPHDYIVNGVQLIVELPRNISFQRSDHLRNTKQPDGSVLFELPALQAQQSSSYILYFKSSEKITQETKAPIYFALRSNNLLYDQYLLAILLKKCQQGQPAPYLSIQLRNLDTDPSTGNKYLPKNKALETELSWLYMTAPFSIVLDWGDGNIEQKTMLWENKTSFNHQYQVEGFYRCKIKVTDCIGKVLNGEFQIEVR